MLQIIPAVDVLDGKVVRLMHGDYDRVTVYGEDPVSQALEWMRQGAELVHVVDLEGARSGAPDESLWRRLADAGVVFQVGGGIRTSEVADRALEAGAQRVVLGTAAVWDPEILGNIPDPTRVVAAVDVRGGKATGAGWLDEGKNLADVLEGLSAAGIGRLLVTGIERDGTMEGPSTDVLLSTLRHGGFSVIASGGVGQLQDLDVIQRLGCEAVIVGRALYERRFEVSDAIRYLKK
ncbi:MAG: 1-(5-phosphoribosyl)-5-[(5-phosphoribosylamino)methylideneamino] imidazole-4-carboxamide isomerase [Acidimicrobiia bacterium]|nr:1-(5-phosphoribosyl)-5-[(5-phosphoribosylamino)methylideneamino] imidazole-4-carboxamide isomerase [Acidimicrobiia bacterium]